MEENKSSRTSEKYKIWIPLVFSLASLIGLIGGYKMAGKDAISNLVVKSGEGEGIASGRVEELVRFIESRYVSDLDSEELIEDAFQNVLDHLDPHSIYLKPDEMDQVNDQMGGSFEGIGIESILLDDTLYVNHLILDGPAAKAGLKIGDQILSINDSVIAGRQLNLSEIRDKLKGDANKELRLEISSHIDKTVSTLKLQLGKVDVKSVMGYTNDEDYAVVRIDRFSSDSYKEFMECLKQLDQNGGFKHLVLDLRGNPGGFLPEATKMLNQIFQEKGKLLVYTQGRKERVSEYKSTGKNFYNIGKVAILVDEGSASGSEIIAGAIQDWDRGLIVGRRTFGKGLVQEQYNMSNGGALRLTVAEYFTPSGRLIQKSFVDKESYRDDIASRIVSGELSGEQEVPILDTTVYKTKIKQRLVYAGGGISPDVYIPLDSMELSSELAIASTRTEEFVFSKFLSGDVEVAESARDFLDSWKSTTDLVSDFRAFLDYHSDEYSWIDPYLEKLLKKEVGKLFFGEAVELQVDFEGDEFLDQSILALSKKNIFAELK